MAEKDEFVRKITVPVEEIHYGRDSRYMELESQEIQVGNPVEQVQTTLIDYSQQHQDTTTTQLTTMSNTNSTEAKLTQVHSHSSAQGLEALGPSPAPAHVGTISSTLTTDVISTVKMRTQTQTSVDTKESNGDRLTQPQETEHDRKRDSTHILEKFEEQAKSFQEQMLLLPSRPKKPRAPSPGIFRQSVGLDHLDNLVRLMEQLTQLRDENSALKKRCEYLENTKSLLQVRTLMGGQEIPPEGPPPAPAGYLTLPTTSRSRQRRISEELEIESHRPRLASAEDSQYLEIEEEITAEKRSSVDQEPLKILHKRSYSTGSIDVPDGVMSEDQLSTANGIKQIEPLVELSKSGSKHKKMSKWAKVKKVFSGHKPTEETGAIGGLEPDQLITVTVAEMTTSQEGTEKHFLTTPHAGLSESRSVDSGVGSGLEGADTLRMSSSSGEPSSPSRKMVHSRSGSSPHDLPSEIGAESWDGAPGWEECKPQRQGSYASGLSDDESSAEGKTSRTHSAKEGKEKAQYLQVDTQYPYVRRSSSLEGLDELQKNNQTESRERRLHRSASTKSDGKSPSPETESSRSSKEKKMHKSAWGRVKDIIHTRRDSLKKRTKKGDKSDSEISEGMDYSDFLADLGDVSENRPSPKSSTKGRNSRERRSMDGATQKSPRLKSSGSGSSPPIQGALLSPQHGGLNIDITQLMGAMSEEYVKKMQEWEDKKNRKSIVSRGSISPGKSKEGRSKEGTPEGAMTPTETPLHYVNVDEIQRNLTESFNRKLHEWEKIKYRRDTSPAMERKDIASTKKKEEKKVKKSKTEKEKEKFYRQREREIHRVEKEVQKLEREKMRLEKERLKALEKEAKIEKMKGRLSQADIETKLKHPILGPLSEYKVTAEFARKLHEWEVLKGLSQEASTSLYLEIQKRSIELANEMYHGEAHYYSRHSIGRRARHRVDSSEVGQLSPPISPTRKLAPEFSLEGTSGELERQLSDESTLPPPDADDTQESSSSAAEEGLTSINITSLEKANVSLMEELRKKEKEYMKAQLEVHNLNEKLVVMKDSHCEALVTYRQEMETLQQGEQPLPQVSLTDLEGKIQELETFGDRVVMSMESAAICKFQSIEGEEVVGVQLMELVDQMKSMLTKVSHTEEASKRSSMMHDFEKLYSHAMQLQVQMNNLRLSHLERNKEIMDLKRQLLLQEVTNLLLQVDITRRETELTHYKESKQRSLQRSSTYSDLDDSEEKVEHESSEGSCKPALERFLSLNEPLQYESTETGERSPRSPLAGDLGREHTLDVFFPFEGHARSSTTSADSTELSSGKSGDTGSTSDDPFIASLPTSDSVEMLPADLEVSSSPSSKSLGVPGKDTASIPVLKLLPVPAAKKKHDSSVRVDALDVLSEHSDSSELKSDSKESPSIIDQQLSLIQVEHMQRTTLNNQQLVSLHSGQSYEITSDQSTMIFDFPSETQQLVLVPSEEYVELEQSNDPLPDSLIPEALELTIMLEMPAETLECPHLQCESVEKVPLYAQSTSESFQGGPSDHPKTIILTQPAKLHQDSTSRMLSQSARLKKESSISSLEAEAPSTPVQPHVIYSSSQLHSKLQKGEKLSEWLKREPKIPTLLIPEYKKTSEKPRLEKMQAVDMGSQNLSTPQGSNEAIVTGLPPSPVIRSRQTRRLRAEEKLAQQKHTSSDLAHLPATPPRSSRHRMATQEQIDANQNGRRSMYVTSDPNLQIPVTSMELLKQSQDLDSNARSAPGGLPRSDQSRLDVQAEQHKPVFDMISKFEKQSSLEEPKHASIAGRISPSPTIMPHVGMVSPVRMLKPASELLQESQKTKGRSLSSHGHIHRLDAMTQRTQSEENTSSTRCNNKENVSEVSYVQTMVHRLSRETTPERKVSSKDSSPRSGSSPRVVRVQRCESPHAHSEFVQHIVRKLTTNTEHDHSRALAPLKDLTNDGQVKTLTEAFNGGSSRSSPERQVLPTSPPRSRATFIHKPRSASSSRSPPVIRALYPQTTSPSVLRRDISGVYERPIMGTLTPTSPRSPVTSRGRFVGLSQPVPYKPDSAISIPCSLSSPIDTPYCITTSFGYSPEHSTAPSPLTTVIPEEDPKASPSENDQLLLREQLSPPQTTKKTQTQSTSTEIEVLEKDIDDPENAQTPRTSKIPTSPRLKRSLFSKKSSAQKLPPSGKSGDKSSKGFRGTIGTLCQQAMSFDLGVSLHLSKDQDHDRVDFRKSDPVKLPSACAHQPSPKPQSAHSDEGNISPQPSEDKSKSKAKFLDHSWLQKSKKLFRVSNTASSEPGECCCQACHGRPGDSTCSLCCR